MYFTCPCFKSDWSWDLKITFFIRRGDSLTIIFLRKRTQHVSLSPVSLGSCMCVRVGPFDAIYRFPKDLYIFYLWSNLPGTFCTEETVLLKVLHIPRGSSVISISLRSPPSHTCYLSSFLLFFEGVRRSTIVFAKWNSWLPHNWLLSLPLSFCLWIMPYVCLPGDQNSTLNSVGVL